MKKLLSALLLVGLLVGGTGCIVPYSHYDGYGYSYDHGYDSGGYHHHRRDCDDDDGGGGLRVRRR